MRFCKYFSLLFALILITSFLSCSSNNTATVRINLGLPELGLLERSTLLDRFRGLFIKKAYAQTEPAVIEKIRVRLTSPGGSVNEWRFNPSPAVTIIAPAGNDQLLEVFADIDPSGETAVLTFRGAERIDLKAGETKEILLQMLAWETKAIVSEPNGSRLYQITSFANPNKITISSLTGVTLEPWDIDFDAKGRIYIANNSSSEGIVRINNFVTPNPPTELFTSTRVNALAIDRKRGIIYFATLPAVSAGQLLTNDVDFSGVNTELTGISGFTADEIISMTVDEDGMLYIAYATGLINAITKFNPFTNSHTGNSYTNNLDFSWELSGDLSDINYWYGHIYVANKSGADNYRVLKLSADLKLVDHYGIVATMLNNDPDNAKGHFYGAHHFAAIRRDGLYIIDEWGDIGGTGYTYDKLVFMSNMDGDGWGIFPDTFSFYYDC